MLDTPPPGTSLSGTSRLVAQAWRVAQVWVLPEKRISVVEQRAGSQASWPRLILPVGLAARQIHYSQMFLPVAIAKNESTRM